MAEPTLPPPSTAAPAAPAAPAVAAVQGACANCGAPLFGPYCAQCGQKAEHRVVSLRRIIEDALEDQLSLHAALPRTLWTLLRYPGRLTREYVAGRVVSYLPPMRLYLMASVLYFLAVAALPNSVNVSFNDTGAEGAAGLSSNVYAGVKGRPGVRVHAGAFQMWVDTTDPPGWLRPAVRRLIDQDRRLQRMDPAASSKLLLQRMAQVTPDVVFVLLPFFALLLKLLYVRRRRLYVEHFVFSMHVHAVAFLVFTLLLVAPPVPFLRLATWLLLAAYLLAAMRTVYGQGWGRTVLKFSALAFTYMIVASIAIGLTTAFVIFSL